MKISQEIIERWRELVEEQTSPLHEASLLIVVDEIKQSLLQSDIEKLERLRDANNNEERSYAFQKQGSSGQTGYGFAIDEIIQNKQQQIKELSNNK